MQEIKQLVATGKLQDAIAYCQVRLKKQPLDTDIRSAYIELLCINGELDKADKQINVLTNQAPETAIGGKNVQQLIRAQQSRVDFSQGGATAEVFSDADAELNAIVALQVAIKDNHPADIMSQCTALEAARYLHSPTQPRDLDDSLAGYLEVLGTNGKFYLVKFSQITMLEWQPASSILEQVWRRVHIDIENGPSGDAFIPLTYLSSQSDAEKLGRETDWQPINQAEDGGLIMYQGVGHKMLLIGESAVQLTDFYYDQENKENHDNQDNQDINIGMSSQAELA
ncbi:Protein of avirulence locus ImpE [Moritella sp. JT01]|uniref:type VI secretion system accessory protein TagJ n=1 Tax=Moritella sp. JT01 TaxID=756698 RepID=UPI00079A8814|nr:type VI secretion system accessory protein TagJ [Moritella sp. JT01]KXO08356.1 Protein of avirulence locus ImpE [Moritella sp. JT01]